MPVRRRVLGWFSPDPRAVLPLDRLAVSRSLRRSLRRFDVRVDTAFDEVIGACASIPRPHGWITAEIIDAYRTLHALGFAHSVEAWSPGGNLVGGLYGVAIGGFFAGESMFHRVPDSSKVALVKLVDILGAVPDALLDVQWSTPHLSSLGVESISSVEYRARLATAIETSDPWRAVSASTE